MTGPAVVDLSSRLPVPVRALDMLPQMQARLQVIAEAHDKVASLAHDANASLMREVWATLEELTAAAHDFAACDVLGREATEVQRTRIRSWLASLLGDK